MIRDGVAIAGLEEGISGLNGLPVTVLAVGMDQGGWAAVVVAGQIQTPEMAMHHQVGGLREASPAGLSQQHQGGLQGKGALVHHGGGEHPLGHWSHLDHQAAGPGLSEIAGLVGITLMQIDRQTQLTLQPRGQGQIGGATAVDHQGIAHGGGGAMEIDRHQAGIGALRTMGGQQAAGPQHLPFLPGWIGQQGRLETAVEVAVAIAPRLGQGFRVADQGAEGQTGGVEPAGPASPGLEQPGGIALIPVGAGHHQHLSGCAGLRLLGSRSVQA